MGLNTPWLIPLAAAGDTNFPRPHELPAQDCGQDTSVVAKTSWLFLNVGFSRRLYGSRVR